MKHATLKPLSKTEFRNAFFSVIDNMHLLKLHTKNDRIVAQITLCGLEFQNLIEIVAEEKYYKKEGKK